MSCAVSLALMGMVIPVQQHVIAEANVWLMPTTCKKKSGASVLDRWGVKEVSTVFFYRKKEVFAQLTYACMWNPSFGVVVFARTEL